MTFVRLILGLTSNLSNNDALGWRPTRPTNFQRQLFLQIWTFLMENKNTMWVYFFFRLLAIVPVGYLKTSLRKVQLPELSETRVLKLQTNKMITCNSELLLQHARMMYVLTIIMRHLHVDWAHFSSLIGQSRSARAEPTDRAEQIKQDQFPQTFNHPWPEL